MRNRIGMLFLVLALIIISACSKGDPHSELKDYLLEYKKAQFEFDPGSIPSQDDLVLRLSPYVAADVLDKMAADRTLQIPALLSEKAKASSQVEIRDLSVDEASENVFDLSYSLEVTLFDESGTKVDQLETNGQSTVRKLDGQWQITRDYFNPGVFQEGLN